MRELDFLKIINSTLHNNEYIGDDCAYLSDLGIYLTQDTLVENVHFSLATTTAKELGYKSIAVNLSDLAACASKPLYVTISLSLPKETTDEFVRGFYIGVDTICQRYGVKVVGGDLTGSDKVVISVCAIGKKVSKYNVSRKYAREGDIIIVTGTHGESAGALKLFPKPNEFSQKHLRPIPKIEQGLILAKETMSDFAMMDSSDGLADALFKLAKESDVQLDVDFDKIPINPNLIKKFPDLYKKLVLWGGEDFELVACVSEETYDELDKTKFYKIGTVSHRTTDIYVVINSEEDIIYIDEAASTTNSFNHFE